MYFDALGVLDEGGHDKRAWRVILAVLCARGGSRKGGFASRVLSVWAQIRGGRLGIQAWGRCSGHAWPEARWRKAVRGWVARQHAGKGMHAIGGGDGLKAVMVNASGCAGYWCWSTCWSCGAWCAFAREEVGGGGDSEWVREMMHGCRLC